MKNRDEEKINCSFCGKNSNAVERIIKGPSVFICNECSVKFNEILSKKIPGYSDGLKRSKVEIQVEKMLGIRQQECIEFLEKFKHLNPEQQQAIHAILKSS